MAKEEVVAAVPGELESRLRILLDKQEIHEALVRYCRGIDRGDPQLVLSAFHEDATDNHTGTELPVAERVPRVLAMATTTVNRTSHHLCNELIEVDGDRASSESYLIAYHRVTRQGRELDWVLGARYVDRFERRGGHWRIQQRTVVYDWQRVDEVRDPPAGFDLGSYFDQAMQGARSPADYSYQCLRG